MIVRYAAMAIAALMCSGGLARANILINGDFESPGVSAGTQVQMTNSPTDTPDGWTYSGTSDDFYSGNHAFDINAQSGSNYVAFGENGTTGGSLSQTFDTVGDQAYLVTFWVAEQQNSTTLADDFSMTASNNDGPGGSLNVNNSLSSSVSGETWIQEEFSFTAGDIYSTLTFQDLGGPGNVLTNLALDNVCVSVGIDCLATVPSPGAIPEPITLGLLGFGLAGLAAVRRSRSRG
jgi:hypothetical protein